MSFMIRMRNHINKISNTKNKKTLVWIESIEEEDMIMNDIICIIYIDKLSNKGCIQK